MSILQLELFAFYFYTQIKSVQRFQYALACTSVLNRILNLIFISKRIRNCLIDIFSINFQNCKKHRNYLIIF